MYLLFSRKLTSDGPAVSRGATSLKRRAPSAARSSLAPLSALSTSSVRGPVRSKNRRSAISVRSGDQAHLISSSAWLAHSPLAAQRLQQAPGRREEEWGRRNQPSASASIRPASAAPRR